MYWNMDPVIFEIGSLSVRWYGLFFALAFLAGIYLMRSIYQKEGIKVEKIDDLLIYMMVGTVVGARLGHVLFYEPASYFAHPLSILKIWEGGLASHGGALGILLAVYFYCRKHEPHGTLWLLDRLSIPIALGSSFIRIGNFFNSEIVGLPSSMPWAVVFQRLDNVARHPVQLYESITYLTIFIVLFTLYRRFYSKLKNGVLFGGLLVGVFSSRIVLEIFKTRQAAYGHDNLLSVGQWLSIPFILFGLWLILRRHRSGNRLTTSS